MSVRIIIGDCRASLAAMDEASIDSCVTDPPYHLTSIVKRFGAANAAPAKVGKTGAYARASRGFMGQTWDGGDVAFDPETWAAVYRVLKPGAHLVAFSGTRTYHRMVCAIEDAGFEIRDQLAWVYGSGFPKSLDVSKAIDKAAGAEREIIAVAGKSGAGRSCMAGDFTGGEYMTTAPATPEAEQWQGWGTALKPAWEPICLARKPLIGTVAANVLEHGTGALNIDGCRVETDEAMSHGGKQASSIGFGGTVPSGFATAQNPLGRWPANLIHDGSEEVLAGFPESGGGNWRGLQNGAAIFGQGQPGYRGDGPDGDSGSAARFFYCAKADKGERLGSKHPTVKPVDLMAWLVRLITPPGGLVLDPFAGSGSTGMACLREGFDAILIEREDEYVADIRRRIAHVAGEDSPLFTGAAA